VSALPQPKGYSLTYSTTRTGIHNETQLLTGFGIFLSPHSLHETADRTGVRVIKRSVPAAISGHAATRSSLSDPRATILSASSGNGLCSAFASSHGAGIHTSRSSSVVKINGMAFGINVRGDAVWFRLMWRGGEVDAIFAFENQTNAPQWIREKSQEWLFANKD
jgi:hypothetical protein